MLAIVYLNDRIYRIHKLTSIIGQNNKLVPCCIADFFIKDKSNYGWMNLKNYHICFELAKYVRKRKCEVVFKKGDKIKIISMKDEPEYDGKEGIIKFIDDIGQIHGSWGGCALIPDLDIFVKID